MRGKQIQELKGFQGRNPDGYFEDLPWDVQRSARMWLWRFCQRAKQERGSVPAWLYAIYCGQARRLALNPPTSAWGRSMLAKRGGKAVQRKYRYDGRNPVEAAIRARQTKAQARRRRKLGLPEPTRHRFLPLD